MTLPASLYELPTLAAALEAGGHTPADVYGCPTCARSGPAAGFVSTAGLPGDQPPFVCHTCASGPFRDAQAAALEAERAALAAWETDAAMACRLERDRLINASLWTTAEGSPLSPACREAWAVWRSAMFRITLDYAGPDSVVWPEAPPLSYT